MGSIDHTMDSNISTPVLLSYRRVHTVDFSYNHQEQRLQDSEKKAKRPSRSFSLCSLLPTRKRTGKWTTNTTAGQYEERMQQTEIERFETDFVFPSQKLEATSLKLQDYEKQAFNLFHSSSFKTETDSGAFSRLSSPDVESEYPDFSDSSISLDNPALQLCEAYSAESNKTKKCKSENKTPITDKTVHSVGNCGGTVTVNGVCYHCNE